MELNIHPMFPEERLYSINFDLINSDLHSLSGCVGRLEGNLAIDIPEFTYTWNEKFLRQDAPGFIEDFNDMIDTLRQGMMKSPRDMRQYCRAHPDSAMDGKESPPYAFRVDTGRYSYLLTCTYYYSNIRFWIYAYSTVDLERHMREASNGIPIFDQQGHERFRMPDGGRIQVLSPTGSAVDWTLKYLDKDRFILFDEFEMGCSMPARQFPNWLAQEEYKLTLIDPPLRANSIDPPRRRELER